MPARSTSVAPPTTKPVDGCLTVAVQIYSYNSEDVTGATLNDGETGGTWTRPASCWAPPAVPTADWPYSSPMPTAGTISGGSVNPNLTTPVNSVRLTFGFFLLGKQV